MPELIEQMYCSQQIVIPPRFPYILKRYAKAAIKTQPYDILRWSYEYFNALAEHRTPPVKLRLEYPVYCTEGGLTRGCLKVLAQQLNYTNEIPLAKVKDAWQGFCLDPEELKRIFCLCDVYMRKETVHFLLFIAVAGGLLTKSLTHTMILLCEALTKEPDGGSAAIPVEDFLKMYRFLAKIDASKDIQYFNGYKEGESPKAESIEEGMEEEEEGKQETSIKSDSTSSLDFWQDSDVLQRVPLIDDKVAKTTRLSMRMAQPLLGKVDRSPSVERAARIEVENLLRERKGRAEPDEEVEQKLREMSNSVLSSKDLATEDVKKPEEIIVEKNKDTIEIYVYDDEDRDIPFVIYGEHKEKETLKDEEIDQINPNPEEETHEEDYSEYQKIADYVNESYQQREERIEDLEQTMDDIKILVDRFKSANYDLGMVAGRQMSTTSGEFVVAHIEKEIMDYIDEQIAILPDPDLKKKKAKPEEVIMIRAILDNFLDENMDVIVPETEEVEEEEQAIPEVTVVYAVPGIGPPIESEIIKEFEDYALDVCKSQADVFMPRNIRHFLCPPLEKFVEQKYETEEIFAKRIST